MKRITIVLVDDHEILMDGMESILNEAPHLQVVGKAPTVEGALTLIGERLPDLVLTDISLGEVSGLELTKRILQQFPGVRVMVLTMHDSVQHMTALLEAGAMGYLLKNVKQPELLAAIDQVIKGRAYIQQSVAGRYARAIRRQQEAEKGSLLTPREIEIIRLIARELTTAEISRQLFLSEHTIDTHRKNIARKTGVKSVVGLLNYAREHGLL
jgi:DNA-binding NarL/FixJ family response regulator